MTQTLPEFETHVWMPSAALPKDLARYVDPDQPLEPGDDFKPSAAFSLLYLYFAAFWWLVSASLVVVLLIELGQRLSTQGEAEQAAGLPSLVLILLLGIALGAVFQITRFITERRAVRRMWQEGRWRDGLFLLATGLLLHKQGFVLFLPRESVTGVERVGRGRGEPPDLLIHHEFDGAATRLSLLHMDLAPHSGNVLKDLEEWIHDDNEGRSHGTEPPFQSRPGKF